MDLAIDVLEELDEVGAVLLDRHFVYKSGKHGPGYLNMDPLFPDVRLVRRLCAMLVAPFEEEFDTVIAPAVGGVALSVLAADSCGQSVAAVWADKDGDNYAVERSGFAAHLAGRRVLVIDDLLTVGTSIRGTLKAIAPFGPEIVGASVIVNRGAVTAEELGVPRLEQLASVNFQAVDPEVCPFCRDSVPIVDNIGHGARFRAEHADYSGGYVSLTCSPMPVS